MPLKRIAAGLNVSTSTVSVWTRDIELTPEQRARNLRGPQGPLNPEHVRRRAEAWSARCRQRRVSYQREGRARARAGEPLHLTGCLLYWAEGAKSRNSVRFVNSDPHMVRLFCRFLAEALDVDKKQIDLRLNVYTDNGLSIEAIEGHWLELLDLPRSCLRKHTLDHLPTSSSGRGRSKLPYGVCTISVHSTRLVQHIYGAIQEYGRFEEPAWLG